jgi:hypothetical protein
MKEIIKNNLIESTIRYTENSSRNNGNLRSGIIIEASDYPEDHVKSGMKVHQKASDNGAMPSEAKSVVIDHATKKLGYSMDKAKEFADHIENKIDDDEVDFPHVSHVRF